jgi:hypothetical protein
LHAKDEEVQKEWVRRSNSCCEQRIVNAHPIGQGTLGERDFETSPQMHRAHLEFKITRIRKKNSWKR